MNASDEGERLQKVLARAGFASRRKCEELIARAHVTVNGEPETAATGRTVHAALDHDGKPVRLPARVREAFA